MNPKPETRNSKLYLFVGLLFVIAGCGNHKEVVGPEVSNRFASWPAPAILEFNPTQDSYYSQVVNTGSSKKLLAGRWQGYKARTLLKFDLSDIPAKAALTEAKLELYCGGSNGSGPANLSLHEITTTAWEEDKVTWKDEIAFQETSLSDKKVIEAGIISWTEGITGFLSQKLTDGSDSSQISLLIKSRQEDLETSIKEFYSKEASDTTNFPTVTVKYESEGETEVTVKLNPTDDVFIITKSESESITGQEDILVVGSFNGYSNRMVVQFPISPGEKEDSLPNEATINYAELRLHLPLEEGNTPLSISIHTITKEWSEGKADLATYNTSAKALGELTSDTWGLNITSLVKDWNRKGGNFGLLVKPADEVSGSSFKGVYSSEHSTPELRPVVVVTYTIPPTEPGYDK